MNFKISVIIPIYNSEKYLKKCVDSVLDQTYKNLEVILIDDGSTDSSGELCDYYAKVDNRVKVIHKKNERIGAARNTGIENATGELITFIDSDDYLDSKAYEKAIEIFKNTDADLVQWDLTFLEEEGCKDVIANRNYFENTKLILSNEEALKKMFEWHNMDKRFNNIWTATHCIWTKMCKRELFRELRFPVGKEYEDEAILHHLFYNSKKCIFINDRFTTYRLRADSTVHTMKISGKLDKIDAYLDRFNLISLLNNKKLMRGASHDYFALLSNCFCILDRDKHDSIRGELLKKAWDLDKRGRAYLGNIDKIALKTMIILPDVFKVIYSNYRRLKD